MQRNAQSLADVNVPENRWVGNDGIGLERSLINVVGTGFRAGRPRARDDVLSHLGLFGYDPQVGRLGLAEHRAAGLDHPLRQLARVARQGEEVVIARQHQTTVLLVGSDADAMAKGDESIGQAQKGIDVAVRADDHDADIELGEGQLETIFGHRCHLWHFAAATRRKERLDRRLSGRGSRIHSHDSLIHNHDSII